MTGQCLAGSHNCVCNADLTATCSHCVGSSLLHLLLQCCTTPLCLLDHVLPHQCYHLLKRAALKTLRAWTSAPMLWNQHAYQHCIHTHDGPAKATVKMAGISGDLDCAYAMTRPKDQKGTHPYVQIRQGCYESCQLIGCHVEDVQK